MKTIKASGDLAGFRQKKTCKSPVIVSATPKPIGKTS